jgi:hypothetical protein
MAVYVDDMYLYPHGQYRGMKMSHMIADTTAELFAMADAIGIERRWLQKAGTHQEHFDISLGKRAIAVRNGAVEVTMRELGMIIRKREVS